MRQLLTHMFAWGKRLQRLVLSLAAIALVTQLLTAPAYATSVYEIPDLLTGDRTWIVDQADVVSRVNEGQINSKLDKLAKETGTEIRFVTIHRFDYGETPETFAEQLFERWFPTPEAQANQILVVLDNVTNGTAIRTGDQVKTALSDAIAESIAQETMQVPLREGNRYNQAFLDASDRLVAVLSGEPDPGPPVVEKKVQVEGTFARAEETDAGSATIWVVGLLIAATVIPMATYYFYVR